MAERDENFLTKNVQSLIVAGAFALCGGGGAASHYSTNEKLDRLVVAAVELKSEMAAEKETRSKSDVLVLQLNARVGDLEREVAVLKSKGK